MSKSFKEDLTGKRFGRLTVLEFVPNDKSKNSHWLCKCSCGNTTVVESSSLKREMTKSCGCFRKEVVTKPREVKHGLASSRIYSIWSCMKNRCYSVKNTHYKHYGGRGISVCDEWRNNFMAFCKWSMANGYDDTLTIDRIDVNGNYEPSNCRWIPRKEQDRNKRSNIIVKYNNEKMCLADVSQKSGISRETLYGRYHRGDRGKRLFRPVKK